MNRLFTLTQFSVYDITKRSSFLSIQRWIEEVRRYTTLNVMLILVGNKCDLESLREVTILYKFPLLSFPSSRFIVVVVFVITNSGGICRSWSHVWIHTGNFVCHGNISQRKYKRWRRIHLLGNRIEGRPDFFCIRKLTISFHFSLKRRHDNLNVVLDDAIVLEQSTPVKSCTGCSVTWRVRVYGS